MCACSKNTETADKTIIPVADAVGTGEILCLSDFAKSVKYIPLETNDSLLIGGIRQVMPIGNRFLIKDALRGHIEKYFIFDEKGKFVIQVGSIGQGPNQYTSTRAVDIDEQGKIYI